MLRISIHAAREGGDVRFCIGHTRVDISIHAAREGGDAAFGQHVVGNRVFQSTPPVKAATIRRLSIRSIARFQSTPPVKAATKWTSIANGDFDISIHAAREGGDGGVNHVTLTLNDFNPRRP